MGDPLTQSAIDEGIRLMSDPATSAADRAKIGAVLERTGVKFDLPVTGGVPKAPIGQPPTPMPPPQESSPTPQATAPPAAPGSKELSPFAKKTAQRLAVLSPPAPKVEAPQTVASRPRELSTDSAEFKASQIPVIGRFLAPLLTPGFDSQATFFDDPNKTPAQNDAAWKAEAKKQEQSGRAGERLVRQEQNSNLFPRSPEEAVSMAQRGAGTLLHGVSSTLLGLPEQAANLVMPGAGDTVSAVANTNPKTALAADLAAGVSKGGFGLANPLHTMGAAMGDLFGAGQRLWRGAAAAGATGAGAAGLHDVMQSIADPGSVTPEQTGKRMTGSAAIGAALLPVFAALGIPAAAGVRALREGPGGGKLVEAENAGVRTNWNPFRPVTATPAIRQAQQQQGVTGEPAADISVRKAAEQVSQGLEGVRANTTSKIHNETEAYHASPEGRKMVMADEAVAKVDELIAEHTDAEGRPKPHQGDLVAQLRKARFELTETIDPGYEAVVNGRLPGSPVPTEARGPAGVYDRLAGGNARQTMRARAGAPAKAPSAPELPPLEQRIQETPEMRQTREAIPPAPEPGDLEAPRVPRELSAKDIEQSASALNRPYGVHTDEQSAKVDKIMAGVYRSMRKRFGPNEVAPEGYAKLREGHHAARTEMESTLQAFGLGKNMSDIGPEVQSQLQAVMNAIKRGGQTDEQIAAVLEANPGARDVLKNARAHLAYDKLFGEGSGANAAITEAGKPHAYMRGGKRLALALDPIGRAISGVEQYPALANMPAPLALASERAGAVGSQEPEERAAQFKRVLERLK